MSGAWILFLPSAAMPTYRWLRLGADGIDARGEGLPPPGDAAPVTAIAPAADVALHWAPLPDRSTAQATAAARLLVAEASATPIAELHVAVGADDSLEERAIGVVATRQMAAWLAELARVGIDPAAIIPAPMLLPAPDTGFYRADLGGEGVVRGPACGFADEARLTELITGDVTPEVLGREAIERAIVAAAAAPPLDLRQGPFARRRRIGIDWPLMRRLGWLAVAILAVSLLISLVEILKYTVAADTIERRIDLVARQGLPRGEAVSDAGRQLDARMARLRGAGLGFSRTAASVFGVIQSVPGSELRAASFDGTGKLKVSVVTQSEGQVNEVKRRIEALGLRVEAGVFQASGGRISGDFTVSAR